MSLFRHSPHASDSNVLFDQFRELYSEHTHAEADEIISPHIGKALEVSGSVRDVSHNKTYKYCLVWLEDDYPDTVLLRFEAANAEEAKLLAKGDEIAVQGNLDHADDQIVHLHDCKLLRKN